MLLPTLSTPFDGNTSRYNRKTRYGFLNPFVHNIYLKTLYHEGAIGE